MTTTVLGMDNKFKGSPYQERIPIFTLVFRLSTNACYNAANTEMLLEGMVELQALLCHNVQLMDEPALLASFEAIVATARDFFAVFSSR